MDDEDLAGVVLHGVGPDRVDLEVEGVRRTYQVVIHGDSDHCTAHVDSPLGYCRLTREPRISLTEAAASPGSLTAPMPGTVVRVAVATGDAVVQGQPLLVLEAMKMEHTVTTAHDGVVRVVAARVGDVVDGGDLLAVIDRHDDLAEAG